MDGEDMRRRELTKVKRKHVGPISSLGPSTSALLQPKDYYVLCAALCIHSACYGNWELHTVATVSATWRRTERSAINNATRKHSRRGENLQPSAYLPPAFCSRPVNFIADIYGLIFFFFFFFFFWFIYFDLPPSFLSFFPPLLRAALYLSRPLLQRRRGGTPGKNFLRLRMHSHPWRRLLVEKFDSNQRNWQVR